jgi:predicted amidophosphoribosyltransferase
MPCYNCGARQTDPERGPSPWARGVHSGRQVLVCPACQASPEWTEDLDHCASCGSPRLSRSLGELRCRDCGAVEEVSASQTGAAAAGLAEDVAAAVSRVLGRAGPG